MEFLWDIFLFYMIVGLVINWGVGLWGMLFEEVEIDPMGFILTIPVWPLTVWNIITSFTDRS